MELWDGGGVRSRKSARPSNRAQQHFSLRTPPGMSRIAARTDLRRVQHRSGRVRPLRAAPPPRRAAPGGAAPAYQNECAIKTCTLSFVRKGAAGGRGRSGNGADARSNGAAGGAAKQPRQNEPERLCAPKEGRSCRGVTTRAAEAPMSTIRSSRGAARTYLPSRDVST